MPKIVVEVGDASSHEFCGNCPNFDDYYCTIFYIGIDGDNKGNWYRCEECIDAELDLGNDPEDD
jgi:hypothetical protein